ncbi:hypothetical protein ABT237_03410 [Streptomyces sp. NPDC001581]|uniref:hypothetical protein n=1 Tax=unclassified Streptomyces TaxID=2593676 RepID=UPI00332DEE0E
MIGNRRPAWSVLLCASLTMLVGLCAGCSGTTGVAEGGSGSRRTPEHRPPEWVEGTTVEGVVRRLHLQLPAVASDARAAQQRRFQDDGLLVAFSMPTGDVDAFLAQLKPEQPVQPRKTPFAGEAEPGFTHLGLPEPDALPDIRKAQACAPCEDDLDQLHVAVTQLDEQTSRVYLKGID